jgi:hypothetical protein
MNWFYKGEEVTDIAQLPENTFGFIYEITQISTGKKYIGKKQLMSYRTLPPLKGDKKKRKIVKEGDWKTYYGSHVEVKKLVKESKGDFKREILQFVPTKKQLTYFENKWLFCKGVIEHDSEYYNDNIENRYFKKDFLLS